MTANDRARPAADGTGSRTCDDLDVDPSGPGTRFVWERALDEVSPGVVRHHVLATLAHGANRELLVTTTAEQLAQATGLGRTAVHGALRWAVTAGWLVVVRRGGRRGSWSAPSRYRLTLPAGYR